MCVCVGSTNQQKKQTTNNKYEKTLQLVEFPEKDFQKELSIYSKDEKKQMELQTIKKNFHKALFENNTLAGFTARIQSKSAKFHHTQRETTSEKPIL